MRKLPEFPAKYPTIRDFRVRMADRGGRKFERVPHTTLAENLQEFRD